MISAVGDHLADLVIVFDSVGTILWMNQAVEPILGASPAEWIGRHGSEGVHPDDVSIGFELLVSALATGPGVKEPVTYRLTSARGGWVEMDCVATTVALAGGDLVIVLACRPTGVARPAEAIWGEVSQRVSLMFDDASIGMAQVSLRGQVLRANAELASPWSPPAPKLWRGFPSPSWCTPTIATRCGRTPIGSAPAPPPPGRRRSA